MQLDDARTVRRDVFPYRCICARSLFRRSARAQARSTADPTRMGRCRFDDGMRCIRAFVGPRAERGPEAVRHSGRADFPQWPGLIERCVCRQSTAATRDRDNSTPAGGAKLRIAPHTSSPRR